jgi:phospholipase/carboxylesterase
MRTFDDLSLRYRLEVPSGRADDESMPMVVMIHGRGADMNDLADLASMLDVKPGIRFIFPNAPRAFEAYPGMAYGWTWFDGWPPEDKSVVQSREVLLRFYGEVTDRYPTGELVISGFSQGAMMALDSGLRSPRKLAGIIAMSGGLYEPELPALSKDVPVLIAHGAADEVVPVNYARRARRVLEDAGLDVEYHEYPMGHQVVLEEATVVKDFLTRVLARS